ncbi:hypothetical protein AGMMS49950_09670 [Endomicrobiia bacterium]|nr:hypothetical protein AGMMS49531_11610 [Endomicrobiia bacterium]GHT71959.1 hypothetical protein AGMMS49950_09670 [Endomicrobiia bacterium]
MRKSLLVFCSFFALSVFVPAVAQADPVYLVLERTTDKDEPVGEDGNAIHGKLSGDYNCDTLENVEHLMPKGTYPIILTDSKFGKRWPEIVISGHTVVRIHAGNKASESEGCILLGEKVCDGYITRSKPHVDEVVRLIRRDAENGRGNTFEIR